MIASLFALLFLCICADCQSDGNDSYGPNVQYDCTPSCSTAKQCSRDVHLEGLRANSLCRCDRECRIYSDCCTNVSICDASDAERNTANRLDGLLQCRSSHLDPRTQPDWLESFWMVSACPADWLAGRDDQLLLDILNNCTSGSANLPPVTDVEGGIVYKNEYCAVCHEVKNFQLWGYRFECTHWLNVMLETDDFQLTLEIVKQECVACGFYAPQTMPSARACLHDSLVNESCFGRQELQDMTGVLIEEEHYQEIVSQCQSGPVSPVVMGNKTFPPFRNQYCAICNAINVNAATEELTCVNPYLYRDTTNHCREEAANLRPSYFRLHNNITTEGRLNFTYVFDHFLRPAPFTIFIDVNESSLVVHTETVSVFIPISCSDGQVFDPITQMCHATICHESGHGESCAIVQNITLSRGSNTTQNDSLQNITLNRGSNTTQNDSLQNITLSRGSNTTQNDSLQNITLSRGSNTTQNDSLQNITLSRGSNTTQNDSLQNITLSRGSNTTQNDSLQNITLSRGSNTTQNDSLQNITLNRGSNTTQNDSLQNITLSRGSNTTQNDSLQNITLSRGSNTTQNDSLQNITLNRGSNTTQNDSLPCDGALISLNDSEFQLLTDNRTLLFRDEEFDILDYIDNMTIICTNINLSVNGTMDINVTVPSLSYPIAFFIVIYVGSLLSVIGCVFVLITYTLFRELRTLPGKILMNLATAILVSCILLLGSPLTRKDELCEATAIFLHWLVLCQFSWMTIMSYELARTLIQATRLKPVQARNVKRHTLLIYIIIGWGLPTVIIGLSTIVNYTTDYIRYGKYFCSINHVASFYVVMVAPVALSVLLNAIAFSVAAYILCRAWRNETKLKKKKGTYYYYIRIYLSVFSITGLTWMLGFVMLYTKRDWAVYLYIVLYLTQGFTISIAFLFTRKVFSLYKQFFWFKISRTFSFKNSSKQNTQDTSMATRYSSEDKYVSTVSSEFTAGKDTETGPTTDHMQQKEETADHKKQEEEQKDVHV